MNDPHWLFLESTLMQDQGITAIAPGDVLPGSMVGAVDIRNVRLPDLEHGPTQRVTGTIRGKLSERLICELDHPCSISMPFEPGPGQGHTPGDRVEATVMFLLMWPYEVGIFSPLCPTHDLRVTGVGDHQDSYRLDGVWVQVRQDGAQVGT